MIHLNLANRTRRENPRRENLRRRHSRVAIAIHKRSEKREEARSKKKREAGRSEEREEARSEKKRGARRSKKRDEARR